MPDFNQMTYEEEAEWWDTHDVGDYAHEFEEVEMKAAPNALNAPKGLKELSNQLVVSNLESAINLRLTKQDHDRLRRTARQKGIGAATLIRMWVLEKLRFEELTDGQYKA